MSQHVRQTIIRGHVEGCWAIKKYGGDWIIEDARFLEFDRIGRRTKHKCNRFVLYRCNDTSCGAQMIVLESDIQKAAGIEGR